MQTFRHDTPRTELGHRAHYHASWRQKIVLNWTEANRLIQNVSVAMTLAGYRGDDITRMRAGMEEVISHILEREQLLSHAEPIHVSYRVNQHYAVTEIQTIGAGSRPQQELRQPETADRLGRARQTCECAHSFMTWIRYSKQDHAATVCDCQLIQ
jgi:hypothetical protein